MGKFNISIFSTSDDQVDLLVYTISFTTAVDLVVQMQLA